MLNNLNIIGRLTKEPVLKETDKTQIVNINVAVDNTRKNQDGSKKTTFIQANAFGELAKIVNANFKKGSLIGLSGELEQDNYTDKDGNHRSTYRVIIEHIAFIDPKQDANSNGVATNDVEKAQEPLFDAFTGKPLK